LQSEVRFESEAQVLPVAVKGGTVIVPGAAQVGSTAKDEEHNNVSDKAISGFFISNTPKRANFTGTYVLI